MFDFNVNHWGYAFAFMLFLHFIEDFHLQGCLANMKCLDWWKKQEGYNDKYSNDYAVALVAHSFEWAFFIHIPLIILIGFTNSELVMLTIAVNMLVHAVVDGEKANSKSINLCVDQAIHLFQIMVTWMFYLIFFN